ncbi:MAG: hypothetical protein WBF17_08140, partial [Phycisphaerae bacterium]
MNIVSTIYRDIELYSYMQQGDAISRGFVEIWDKNTDTWEALADNTNFRLDEEVEVSPGSNEFEFEDTYYVRVDKIIPAPDEGLEDYSDWMEANPNWIPGGSATDGWFWFGAEAGLGLNWNYQGVPIGLSHLYDGITSSEITITSEINRIDMSIPGHDYFIKVPRGYAGDLDDLIFDLCNSVTCNSEMNCCELSLDSPLYNCPSWFVSIVDHVKNYGLIHYNWQQDYLVLTADPTPCESPVARPNGPIKLLSTNGGRHYQKREDGTIWAINSSRTALLKTTNAFLTVTSYSLPAAIAGDNAYIGIDIHVDNPVVWGIAGVYILNIDTGIFHNVTGDLYLDDAIQDPFGALMKNISTVD